MPSATVWKLAERPNYTTNVDKIYPYSEVPYLGEYYLEKIPSMGNIPHVDYWGEGYVVTDKGVRGFKNSYNVNHQHQLVSSGADRDRKIPNRIPVHNYTDCDTSAYIKDNSVTTVTVAGPDIHNSARDIARIVNQDGQVIVFGVNEASQITELAQELKKKGLLPIANAALPSEYQGQTFYSTHVSFLKANLLKDELYRNVANSNFETAIELTKDFSEIGADDIIKETVTKLIGAIPRTTMIYAYKLWHGGAENVVRDCFPEAFALIFNEDAVKIVNKEYRQPLKLDAHTDSYNDRLAWGDNICESDSKRLSWKVLPIWEDGLIFKLYSTHYNMYLKLDANVDNIGDRKAWGSTNSNERRHGYYLDPIFSNGVLTFYIVNRQYGQGLKLDVNVDKYGDRLLWGHHNDVHGETRERFRWQITAF